MKGLLLKDFYMTGAYCRLQLGALALCAVGGAAAGKSFLIAYAMMFAGLVPVYLLSYDEKSRWSGYAEVFPYTRREVVAAKYVTALAVMGAAAVLVLLALGVRNAVVGDMEPGACIRLLSLSLSAGLLLPGILLPVMFWLGVERGRIVTMVLMVLFAAALGGVGSVSVDMGMGEMAAHIGPAAVAAPAAAALILLLSWRLAVWLYGRRELS